MRSEGVPTDFDRGFGEDRITLEADQLLDEFAESSVAYLAQGLVERADAYSDGRDAAMAIAAELRRRQAAGVRFWPDGKSGPSDANHSA